MARRVEDAVTSVAEPLAASLGYELVLVQHARDRGEWFLRCFIDRPGGVTLDDCQAFSEALKSELDARGLVPEPYTLEVASPGLDRPLVRPADYERFRGRRAELVCYSPVAGRRRWVGRLAGLDGDRVRLVPDGTQEEVPLPLSKVARARLVVEW